MTLNELLGWFASGTGSVIAVSWIIEYYNLFDNMDAKKKQLVFALISAAITIVAQLINMFVPTAVLTAIAPVFLGVAVIFVNIFLGTAFHKVTKAPSAVEVKEEKEAEKIVGPQ